MQAMKGSWMLLFQTNSEVLKIDRALAFICYVEGVRCGPFKRLEGIRSEEKSGRSSIDEEVQKTSNQKSPTARGPPGLRTD